MNRNGRLPRRRKRSQHSTNYGTDFQLEVVEVRCGRSTLDGQSLLSAFAGLVNPVVDLGEDFFDQEQSREFCFWADVDGGVLEDF